MQVTAQANCCSIDGRVQGGMQFGVLVQVVFWLCGMLFEVLVTVRRFSETDALGVLFGGAGAGALLHFLRD